MSDFPTLDRSYQFQLAENLSAFLRAINERAAAFALPRDTGFIPGELLNLGITGHGVSLPALASAFLAYAALYCPQFVNEVAFPTMAGVQSSYEVYGQVRWGDDLYAAAGVDPGGFQRRTPNNTTPASWTTGHSKSLHTVDYYSVQAWIDLKAVLQRARVTVIHDGAILGGGDPIVISSIWDGRPHSAVLYQPDPIEDEEEQWGPWIERETFASAATTSRTSTYISNGGPAILVMTWDFQYAYITGVR